MKLWFPGLLAALLCGAGFSQSRFAADEQPQDLTPVTLRERPVQPPVALVSDGKPLATIVVMGPRSTALNTAVNDLQAFIAKSTGATLPIVSDKITSPAIVIGDCDLARQHGLVGKDLPADGFAIKTIADHVLIVGNSEIIPGTERRGDGTAWGTFDFSERFVGVRWYFPGELGQSVPQTKTLAVAPVWLQDAPAFRMRLIWPPMANPWNGTGTQLSTFHTFLRAGNSWPHELVVHSPDWSKVTDYTEKRPEVFQQRSDGTRDFSMLCYGHPKTLETYLENIERHQGGQTPVQLGIKGQAVTVSPADAEIACNCDYCQKLWDKQGGQYGSASRIVGKFAADLGREVKRRWPELTVLYLPYFNYTLAPEGIEFPDNVEVQLCGMPGLAQYKEPGIAASEQTTIDRWIKLTGRKIQNWHYSCWPEDRTTATYLFPHTIRDFYRQNRDKTVGTFINGTTDHWPRQHLSLYCWMKVLWNPDFDVDATIDEYCRRMYGPAAATMKQLVVMQTDGWEKSRWPGGRMSPKAIYQTSFPHPAVVRMTGLLEQARQEAAGNEVVLQRLEYYAAPFAPFVKQSLEYSTGAGMKPLIVQKVAEDPQVDGKLDEAVWKQATPVPFVRGWDKQRSQPIYPTTIQGVWTPMGLTLGFRMVEPTPQLLERGIKGHDDSMAWWDDNVELVIDVTGKNEGEFYHFTINPNAAIADAKGLDFSRDFPDVKAAAFVGQDFWSVEVFLPYAAFPEAARPGPGANTVWHGSFTRHRVAEQGAKPKMGRQQNPAREYQRMNTTYAGPSNNLNDFAPIKFSD